MAVSPFHRLSQGKVPTFLEPKCSARSEHYHPLSTARRRNVDPHKKPTYEHAQASAAPAASSKSPLRSKPLNELLPREVGIGRHSLDSHNLCSCAPKLIKLMRDRESERVCG